MDAVKRRRDHDAVADCLPYAFPKDAEHLGIAEFHGDLRFRSQWFDEHYLRRHTASIKNEVFRTDAVDGLFARKTGCRNWQGQHDTRRFQTSFGYPAGQEVHRWPTNEACNELICRAVVKFKRCANLLDPAAIENRDPVGHRHRLDLILRHIDRGGLQPLVQRLDLAAHDDAQLRIKVGQGLIEQEHLRIAHDGAAHRDPLALTAGELPRITVEQLRKAKDARPFRRLPGPKP